MRVIQHDPGRWQGDTRWAFFCQFATEFVADTAFDTATEDDNLQCEVFIDQVFRLTGDPTLVVVDRRHMINPTFVEEIEEDDPAVIPLLRMSMVPDQLPLVDLSTARTPYGEYDVRVDLNHPDSIAILRKALEFTAQRLSDMR